MLSKIWPQNLDISIILNSGRKIWSMTMTFILILTLTESPACLENFRSENLCQDEVVGWGEGCPADYKDQLKFELIKIQEA